MQNIQAYIDRHIRADATGLVASLAMGSHSVSDRTDMGKSLGLLAEAAQDLSAPFLDYEAAARAAGYTIVGDTVWKEICKHDGITPHEIPIIGHYIVTAELADKLEARGERVERDFGGVIVWARKQSAEPEIDGPNKRIYHLRLDRDPVLLAIMEPVAAESEKIKRTQEAR